MEKHIDNIKEWYEEHYEDDDMGDHINSISWSDLWAGLCRGDDVYDVIGVGDSVIRERLFEGLSKVLGCDYNVVYYTWLGDYNKALLSLMVRH